MSDTTQMAGQVALVTGASRGITHVIECGPGKALAGMTKRIDAALVGASLYDPATLAEVKALVA